MEKKAILKDIQDVDTTPKTDHAFTIDSLESNKNIRKKVIFNSQSQAKAYSLLETIAERHNNVFLKRLIAKQLEYIISVGGRGREDIVTVSKFKGEQQSGWMEKFVNFTGRR